MRILHAVSLSKHEFEEQAMCVTFDSLLFQNTPEENSLLLSLGIWMIHYPPRLGLMGYAICQERK